MGWGMHVNPWLIHINVWQKPLQYCKVISLQLIKINGKKTGFKLFVFFISWVIYIVFYKWMGLFDSSVVKVLPANAGDVGLTLSQEDPLEKEMATEFSISACEIS